MGSTRGTRAGRRRAPLILGLARRAGAKVPASNPPRPSFEAPPLAGRDEGPGQTPCPPPPHPPRSILELFSPGGQKAPFRRLRRPIRPLGAELRFLRGPFGQRDVVLPVPLSQRPPVPDPCLSPEPSRTTSSLAVLLAAAAVRRPLLHPQKGLVGYDCGVLRPGHETSSRRAKKRRGETRRGLDDALNAKGLTSGEGVEAGRCGFPGGALA